MEQNKRIVEIQGHKFEVDLRSARKIEEFKIGDNVKVLMKDYSDWKVYPGVIVGFENFNIKPTIMVCYLIIDYSSCKIKFLYFNEDSKETEITLSDVHDIPFEKSHAIDFMDREINKKEIELEQYKKQKEYFLKHFNKYFEQIEE